MDAQKIILKENELKMQFTEDELQFKKDCLKNVIRFWKNKQFSQLTGYAKESVLKLPSKAYGDGDKDISEIYYLLASSIRELEWGQDESLAYALKSGQFERLNKNVLWLIRDIKSQFSEQTQLKRIQVN